MVKVQHFMYTEYFIYMVKADELETHAEMIKANMM